MGVSSNSKAFCGSKTVHSEERGENVVSAELSFIILSELRIMLLLKPASWKERSSFS